MYYAETERFAITEMNHSHQIQGTVKYINWKPVQVEVRDGLVSCQPSGEPTNQDFRKKVPPHVAFANLLVRDKAAVKNFVSRYGMLRAKTLPKLTVKGFLSPDEQRGLLSVSEPLLEFERVQKILCSAWGGDVDVIKTEVQEGFSLQSFDLLKPTNEVVFVTEDLWKFIVFLFLVDYKHSKVGVCANEDCPAPYFLRTRKGQEFCSHACAVLVNVRRFRARQARTEGK